LLKTVYAVDADEKGNNSKYAKAAVDETPWQWNTTDRAGDESERKH
jgi:hypothetical protein